MLSKRAAGRMVKEVEVGAPARAGRRGQGGPRPPLPERVGEGGARGNLAGAGGIPSEQAADATARVFGTQAFLRIGRGRGCEQDARRQPQEVTEDARVGQGDTGIPGTALVGPLRLRLGYPVEPTASDNAPGESLALAV